MTKIQELSERAKALASEIHDSKKWQLMVGIIDELAGIAEASTVYYGATDTPPSIGENEGYSDDVLIDIDGYRKHFSIGYYDYDNKRWFIRDEESRPDLDLEHMSWTYLPLAKYDKK